MFPIGFTVAEGAVLGYDTFSSVISSLSTAIPVSTIVAVVGAVLGVTVGFGFAWWGAKYGVRKLMAAIKKGKTTV